jgi:hypothetical protein
VALALAQRLASLKTAPARVEPGAAAFHVRAAVMRGANTRPRAEMTFDIIRPGVAHDHHCTAYLAFRERSGSRTIQL